MKAKVCSLVVVLLIALGIAGVPSPAAAHSGASVDATNYRSSITSVEPDLEGATLSVEYLGDQLVLVNDGPEITVLGYEGEPYLRIGPDGVWENRNSPALYLNVSQDADNPVPDFASAKKSPDWLKASDSSVAGWHDHRIHWMNESDSPLVIAEPYAFHSIYDRWQIQLLQNGREIAVVGNLVWVPAPSPVPWWIAIGSIVAIALALGAMLVRRGPSTLRAAVPVVIFIVVADLVHTAGVVVDFLNQPMPRITDSLHLAAPQIFGAIAAGVAVKRLRSGESGAEWFLIFAGFVFGYGTGWTFVKDFESSQLYFPWGQNFDRLSLLVAFAGGIAMIILAAANLIASRASTSPTDGASTAYSGRRWRSDSETGVDERDSSSSAAAPSR